MPTARAIFQAHIDGLTALDLASVSAPITVAWTFEDAAGDVVLLDLPLGATTLTRPPKATMLIFIPPATNVIVPVLKGAAADPTGVALAPNCATILALAAGPVVITLTVAVAGVRLIWL